MSNVQPVVRHLIPCEDVLVDEANPRRLFDRAVVKTLSQWHFNNGTDGRMVEIDVDFRR